MRKLYNVQQATGTFDTVAAGSQVNGASVDLGGAIQRIKSVSALVVVDAETSTFTIAAKWQVSNDNSTFVDVANATANTAATVLATGTGGADAAVTRVIPAPDAVYGFKYCRLALVAGGTTGAAVDTYTVGYSYAMLTGGES